MLTVSQLNEINDLFPVMTLTQLFQYCTFFELQPCIKCYCIIWMCHLQWFLNEPGYVNY